MVKWVRLDERMIHGQVATKWSRLLGVDRIIVGNDDAASNSVVQQSLMMAAPPTCKVAIVTVEKAIALCNDPRAENLKILLIVANPDDLLTVVKAIPNIPQVNVGNYGRIAPKKNAEIRKTYDRNLYAYDDEVAVLKEVIACGYPCNLQTTPDETSQDLTKVLGG